MRHLVITAALLAMTACGQSGQDGGAQQACSKFAQTSQDAQNGLITDTELREAVQSIESSARLSDDQDIAMSARSMLAAVTAGDDVAMSAAIIELADACDVDD